MSRQIHFFDAQVDARITQAYESLTKRHDRTALAQCARDVGLAKWLITKRGRDLGLAKAKEPRWSAEEVEIVRANRFYSPVEIARRLRAAGFKRSRLGVLLKRCRLRLTTRVVCGDGYTANALARLLNVDAHAVTGWIDRGLLRAERRLTTRCEKQGGDGYWITAEAWRAFVFAYPEQIDLRKADGVWFIGSLRGTGTTECCDEEHF